MPDQNSSLPKAYIDIANTFFPIVKPEKFDSFLNSMGNWFVLDDSVESSKKPGLLKGIFSYASK